MEGMGGLSSLFGAQMPPTIGFSSVTGQLRIDKWIHIGALRQRLVLDGRTDIINNGAMKALPSPVDAMPSTRRVTLASIARQAGVSTASVSHALNGQPGVSDETRTKILEIAQRVGFRPNQLARALRNGRSHVIGLLLADITNPFYPEIAAGVIRGSAELGHQTFVSDTREGQITLRKTVDALLGHQCDGLIFTSLDEAARPILEELARLGIPFVQLVRHVPGVAADFVGVDDEGVGRVAAQHVLERGCRDVAVLAGPQTSSASRGRLAGARRCLESAGVVVGPHRLRECALTYESGYAEAIGLLAAVASPPDAIICGNDVMALGAIDAIIDRGWRVPADVAVVGCDDMSFSSSRLIQLTTVALPREEMGLTAARFLADRIADPTLEARRRMLPHKLIVRRTSLWPGPPEPTHRRDRRTREASQ